MKRFSKFRNRWCRLICSEAVSFLCGWWGRCQIPHLIKHFAKTDCHTMRDTSPGGIVPHLGGSPFAPIWADPSTINALMVFPFYGKDILTRTEDEPTYAELIEKILHRLWVHWVLSRMSRYCRIHRLGSGK